MSRAAQRIAHSTLAAGVGRPLDGAPLSDNARLAVVLQTAGLLSLCEVAGWRLRGGFDAATIDVKGALRGLAAEPGRAAESAPQQLLRLLTTLFRAEGGVAGRGTARRAARRLEELWGRALDRPSADRAVTDLLAVAPFLDGERFAAARASLAGALWRDGIELIWIAGRREQSGSDSTETIAALVERGRWREAVAVGRERGVSSGAEKIAFARALWASGRAETALVVLADATAVEAETVRAECLLLLGRLGAARETLRRLEAADLDARALLAAGDVALRVFANCGELDAARDWAARAVARARGGERTEARLLVALAAIDRGELAVAASRLAEVLREKSADASPLVREVRLQLALAENDGALAAELAGERLRSERRTLPLVAAGRLWSNIGSARSLRRDFAGAERGYAHAARLLRRCDGPLWLTLAGANLVDVRLRSGKLREVEEILERFTAWNRRSGNVRGAVEDELTWIRFELVRGELARAAERCDRELERQERFGVAWGRERLAVLAARALGWLGRPAAARARLASPSSAALEELEPEEVPFLFALAGETERGLASAAASGLAELVEPLLAGESPRASRWAGLDRLEPFRRARFVVDAELVAPGSSPRDRRAEAAALFRKLGATGLAEICERGETVAWQALGRFFERPVGDRTAIEELLAAIGHPEAELVVRRPDGERRLAGSGGRELAEERSAAFGDGELVLRTATIDEPLRALFTLFRRDLPPPSAGGREAEESTLAGESPALKNAVARLARFAPSELSVLILGENGTGKELAAAEIHRQSARRGGPWVPVNCAGLSETLLLSELFGHARGAFTGADQARAGVFESARGGTVFLDEIGDLPLVAQGSLLRVLQEREIRRLGESLPRKVDARVVAATNRELETMVEEGRFRRDLYFRLKVAIVALPPLRERGGDVELLAERFLEALRVRQPRLRLTPEARRALAEHSWPGNVRELKNALEAAAALTDDGRIAPAHLELGTTAPTSEGSGDYHHQVENFRRRLIEAALAETAGSLAGAARRLGVTRQFLSQFVKKYGLKVKR